MKKKVLWMLILMAYISVLAKGQTKTISEKYRGEILDKNSRVPLESVHVILNGTSEGTITNTEGYFEISIRDDLKKDSLRITHLGYSLKMISVKDLNKNGVNQILLEPSSTILQEVTVSAGLTPNEILRKVRENLDRNFPQKPFSSQLFYRHQRQLDDSVSYIEEAAIDFYDAQGFKREPKGKILKGKFFQVKQLRKSTSRDAKQFVSLWDLPVFWTSDPVLSTENLLAVNREKDYSLKLIGRQQYGDTEVLEIDFSCLKPSVSNTGYGFPSPNGYEGKIFIDLDTYAIVSYLATVKWPAKMVSDKKFLARFNILNPSVFERSAQLEFSYKKVSGLYFLHYAKMKDHFQFSDPKSHLSKTRSYNNELLSVRTNVQNPMVLTETILRVDSKDIPYNQSFWETFNFISESKKK